MIAKKKQIIKFNSIQIDWISFNRKIDNFINSKWSNYLLSNNNNNYNKCSLWLVDHNEYNIQ